VTDTDRVVQVFAPVGSDGRGNKGTGYLIGDGLVLTARHVIENATGPCEVRALGHTDWPMVTARCCAPTRPPSMTSGGFG
jgi:V8-like Glu-specific endopeptidase